MSVTNIGLALEKNTKISNLSYTEHSIYCDIFVSFSMYQKYYGSDSCNNII